MKQLLRDIAIIGAGQGAPQGDSNYCNDGTPFVKAGNLEMLTSGGSLKDIQKVSDAVAKTHKLKLYPRGTVLFAKSGMSCLKGYVYVLPQEAYVVSHLACISPKEDLSEYLRFYFNYHKPNQLVKDTAYPSISLSDIGALEIDTKDEKARKDIVLVLQSIEAIIDCRKRQLRQLEDLIKARFVEMFGNPITNPKGWETYQLNDCLERIDNGTSFVCSDKPRVGDYPAVLKLSAATYGDYRPEENKALLDKNQFVKGAEVHSSDLLFTRKNTPELVGMAAYVQETPEKLMMPDLIFRLVTNDRMNPVFLWQLINCKEFRPIIQGISGGSAKSMSNISKERLGKINVICPPRQLQDQLVPFVQQVDKSKAVVQKALDEAQLLFDSLMQQYFG